MHLPGKHIKLGNGKQFFSFCSTLPESPSPKQNNKTMGDIQLPHRAHIRV